VGNSTKSLYFQAKKETIVPGRRQNSPAGGFWESRYKTGREEGELWSGMTERKNWGPLPPKGKATRDEGV